MIKNFDDFVSEGYESHYRVRQVYQSDPVFRHNVEHGKLRGNVGGYDDGKIELAKDEHFYGRIEITPNALLRNQDKIIIRMIFFTENPKTAVCKFDRDLAFEKAKEYIEMAYPGADFNRYLKKSIFIPAKVKLQKYKTSDTYFITEIEKIYKDADECENDMIQSLMKKSED